MGIGVERRLNRAARQLTAGQLSKPSTSGVAPNCGSNPAERFHWIDVEVVAFSGGLARGVAPPRSTSSVATTARVGDVVVANPG